MFGPEILLEAEENIKMVRENLKITQSRQRSYADTRRRELSFEVGDFVYLKVSPIRRVRRFGVKGTQVFYDKWEHGVLKESYYIDDTTGDKIECAKDQTWEIGRAHV